MKKYLITTITTSPYSGVKKSEIVQEDELLDFLEKRTGLGGLHEAIELIFEIPAPQTRDTEVSIQGIKTMRHAINELPSYLSTRVYTVLNCVFDPPWTWADRPIPEIHSQLELDQLLKLRNCGEKTINAISDLFADNGLQPKWQRVDKGYQKRIPS